MKCIRCSSRDRSRGLFCTICYQKVQYRRKRLEQRMAGQPTWAWPAYEGSLGKYLTELYRSLDEA